MFRALFFVVLLFLTACSDSNKKSTLKLQGSTMGTQYHISIVIPKNQNIYASDLKKQIDDLLVTVNQQMSTYIPTSEISSFNNFNENTWFPVSNDFASVVSSAQNVSKLTNGAFDITVAPLIDLWGFGAKENLSTPTEDQITLALQETGYLLLEVRNSPPALQKLNNNIRIDLSAIAKGFGVDKISQFLEQQNYTNYLVEIGGEMQLRGKNKMGKPWRVGIEKPTDDGLHINKTLLASNLGIATSGDYRNYFMKDGIRFSHTINPNNGKPIRHKLASVSVLHESTMMADAYATALMVMGEVEGKKFVEENNLKVNMTIRETTDSQSWENWQNITGTSVKGYGDKCITNQMCAFLE